MGDAYLGLGLTDVIITRLSQITEIDVRPTSSVLRYADSEVDPAEAARELAVDSVLLGRVTKSGDRVRVTVQLINVAASSLLWADKLDLSSTDIFTYEDVIAEHVARTLRLQLSGQQFVRLTKRHTENSEAYQWYLRGRYYLSKRTPENFQKAIQSFEEATNADPNYALAYSGLSECYTLLNYYGVISPEIGGARAKSAAERALEADDALAEAHTAAALVAFWHDWDWLRTQIEFERAISLNPAYSPAHQWYGCYLVATRQFDRAASIGERALGLDPLVPTVNMALGKIYFFSRRYDEAIKHCTRALSLEPDFVPALHFLGQAYLQKGMFHEALAGYEKAMKILGRLPIGPAVIACTQALAGDKTAAEEALIRLQELAGSGEIYVPAFGFALIHTGLGNTEQALDWLEKAYEERFIWMVYLNVDPVFDGLRNEARFKQLIERMRFPGTNQERWQRLDELFHAAIEHGPDARKDFVAEVCRDDAELRQELESMLSHHEAAGNFIESPAYALAAEAILSDESNEALEGRVVGPYEILEVLGSGGMGVVYVAFDQDLRRKVALKFLHHDLTGDKSKVLRFRQEARAASALNHPNILTVFAIGELEGRHYIGTELVEGETLREVIKRGPMKLGELLHIAVQTSSALAAAHAAGIMHRDIKPENIMVRPDGYVKVLDFGLAKLIEPSVGMEHSTLINTEQGTIIGTVHYMSPEQARGLPVDRRTDIWSMGVMLYELVTGSRPFDGKTRSDIIASILERVPRSLAASCKGAPEKLQLIVNRMLAKDLDERYQTANDLLIDLKTFKRQIEFDDELGNLELNSIDVHAETRISPIRRVSPASDGSGRPSQSFSRDAPRAAISSLAIMPMVNGSADPNAEYLSDGITESIINKLSQLPNLRVMARSTVFRYKGREFDPIEIGSELGVGAVLTGRVLQLRDSLIISTELVDVTDGSQLWGQQYNRTPGDIFAVQEEISKEISETLQTQLSGEEEKRLTKRHTENPEAYKLYLKGRYYWNKREKQAVETGIEFFDRAIDVDPNYALAYAGLADSFIVLAFHGLVAPGDVMPKAKYATEKALQIDETLAEARISLAYITGAYDWDWLRSEREYRHALRLNPNYATAHHWYGEHLATMGRFSEAIAELKRAQELDPLSLIISSALGLVFYLARQNDRAMEEHKRTLDLDQNFAHAHFCLGLTYLQDSRFDDAIEELQKTISLLGENPRAMAGLAYAYAISGQTNQAQELFDELEARSQQQYVAPYLMALICIGFGDHDQAFAWFEKGCQERDLGLVWINVEPPTDSLRSDPRFELLLRRVGFLP